MNILMQPIAGRKLKEKLAATGAPAVRLSRDQQGDWNVAFAAPQPGDHTGTVGDVPFAVPEDDADDSIQMLVLWNKNDFTVGPMMEHTCGFDPEVRE